MDGHSPRISVVMSVYNGEKYLREAVDSILSQTFTDFEFIIIDDSSTDRTAQILDDYLDNRIVRIKNEKNIGLSASLNKGIDIARGEYIARMDADDISLPERLSLEHIFMSNSDTAVVGTEYLRLDQEQSSLPKSKGPHTNLEIMWHALFQNPFVHSTVMYKTQQIREIGGYSILPEAKYVEDYELWLRLIKSNQPMAILPKPLVKWRYNLQGVSFTHAKLQYKNFWALVEKNIHFLIPENQPDIQQIKLLWSLQVGGRINASITEIRNALLQLERLVTGFENFWELNPQSRESIQKLAITRTSNTIIQLASFRSYEGNMAESKALVKLAMRLDPNLIFYPLFWRTALKAIIGVNVTEILRQLRNFLTKTLPR